MNSQTVSPKLRAVVVTGGANGIGAGIVSRLAQDGYQVLFGDIDSAQGGQLQGELSKAGFAVQFVHCDVSRPDDVLKLAGVAGDLSVPLYGIVNNAGIFPRHSFLDLTLDDWEKVIATNLTGPFFVTRQLAPLLIAQGDGVVIFTVSGLSYRGDALGIHYSASKHGLRGLAKSLALALGPKGVRVNSIAPGATETAQALQARSRDELLERGKLLPLGRVGQPSDVAGVVAFLLADDARYITGQTLLVNGGADMP
jgi:NAD(P)-dependent dehydrogenase (short-subunit alcohol dehydrogenase family)